MARSSGHENLHLISLSSGLAVQREDEMADRYVTPPRAGLGPQAQRQGVRIAGGVGNPKSKWVKGSRRNPLIPRETKRWKDLYRGRASVEREFGRLNYEYGLAPLRVCGVERVALHADLPMLARLSLALARARAIPLAA
jgi:hypothetical protein